MAAPKVPDDLIIPPILVRGTPMTKISTLSKRYTFSIDAEHGVINYHSSRGRSIPIESIREIRTGADCRYHRKEYGMSEKDETRWLSITYLKGDTYKMLHLIADDDESFKLWRETLTKMITDRQGLMQGLGQLDRRQALWFKQYWKKANGPKPDNQLDFKEIQQLANYLNVGQSQEQLKALFKQAKPQRSFLPWILKVSSVSLKLLDSRPEIDLIFKNALAKDAQVLDSAMFQKFLVETQGVDPKAAPSIFDRYAKPGSGETKYVDLKAFKSFSLSEDNSPFKTLHGQVYQDMTQPIRHVQT
ncbi:hypothetical protein DL96DRAFT_1755119 [Flagelloscypha sp. PMI_526]|nr:hypothetical protein DL96DRAFT_1755119 [Flagelloscypha sp. PMI_526]